MKEIHPSLAHVLYVLQSVTHTVIIMFLQFMRVFRDFVEIAFSQQTTL